MGGDWGGCAGVGGGKRRFAACRVSCGLPRFLRSLGCSQRLRDGVRWGVGYMPRFAACRVSCGLWAARNACGVGWGGAWGACRVLWPVAFLAAFGPLATLAPCGALGREGHAALCGLPRFLRPWAARNACVGGVRWGVRGMPRFAACRVSCGLRAARNACGGWGALGRGGHAALCNLSRFLRPLGRSQRLRGGALGRGGHAALCSMPRFLRPLGRSQRLLFVLRHRDLGRCPKPRQGPEAPAPHSFIPPYRTTRFLSLRISSVTPSGGSPNVALSVLLPPSHVSCIAISLASIRQPSSTTVTTSPTS